MPKICDFCQNFKGWEGGQHEQHFVKNKFVKNRVGGRVVNLNLDNVFKYTVFFWRSPLSELDKLDKLGKLKILFTFYMFWSMEIIFKL